MTNLPENATKSLSIYDENKTIVPVTKKKAPSIPDKVLTDGLGKRIMKLLTNSNQTFNCLRMDAKRFKEYALSTEGKVKFTSIAICTSVFGIYGLFNTKSRFKRVMYPLTGMALTSSVCYPSAAYKVTKATLIKAHDISRTGWAHTKYGYDVMKEKYFPEPDENEEDVLLQEEHNNEETNSDVAKSMNVPNMFELENEAKVATDPIKGTPGKEPCKASETVKTGNTLIEKLSTDKVKTSSEEDKKPPSKPDENQKSPLDEKKANLLNPNFDYGQSTPDDKELYTTRL